MLNVFFQLNKTLPFPKCKGADFKYDNSFLEFWRKSNQIRHFCPQVETFFVLKETL